jgi:hypothetical protein
LWQGKPNVNTDKLVGGLGYNGSAGFLHNDNDYARYPGYAHVFRQAKEKLNLRGVYTLREPSRTKTSGAVVPLVYVCEAEDEQDAARIHRGVWNQNVAPFLLVATNKDYRLYSGFSYESDPSRQTPMLKTARTALDAFAAFSADAIDEGRVWDEWRQRVRPEGRVDWSLLRNLEALGDWLRKNGLQKQTAHALIGKYVYLHYLRDRGILSDRKLDGWGVDADTVFGKAATRTSLAALVEKLDGWLNGSVFPLEFSGVGAVTDRHVSKVAAVFKGDEPGGQQHLDFTAYDFSHIPIETLSVVYEQFLHAEGKGAEKGAYYTPSHLVSFILDEMDASRPLVKGMTVLDPACGSGAFLVQCYRRIVERELAKKKATKLRPVELRSLLTDHVFGVEQDADACGVAGLSLVLALLDYVDPPDLENAGNFKLPDLRGENIHQGDFFAADAPWGKVEYDWVVGNPPWKPADDTEDRIALAWMNTHKDKYPVGGKQLAEAFAWKVAQHTAPGGQVGLLLPAMTLFKKLPKQKARKAIRGFRQRFFDCMDVSCVVNFANLAEVLFAGRARLPAAAFFYSARQDATGERSPIVTYAPLVVNQEANRPAASSRGDTWAVAVNASEIRELPWKEVAGGESLPWKLAMWGTARDKRLLERLKRRLQTFAEFRKHHSLLVHEGPQLRDAGGRPMGLTEEDRAKHSGAPVDPIDVAGKKMLNMEALRGCGRIFAFPDNALKTIPDEYGFVRKGRKDKPLAVCNPPHIIMDASRRFAVFSDEFLVVPARQVGIAGPSCDASMLKALALLLTSDVATYHQFFAAAQWGIQKSLTNMETLDSLPVPSDWVRREQLSDWAHLHDQLAAASLHAQGIFTHSVSRLPDIGELERRLNQGLNGALGLSESEQWLVDDLVHVRMGLVQGKVDECAARSVNETEMREYCEALADELDGFMDNETKRRHFVRVVRGQNYAVVEISFVLPKDRRPRVEVLPAATDDDAELRRIRGLLRKRHQSQWLYFDRALRLYEGDVTCLFKPLQRLHWLRSQALADADEIIADHLGASERKG